MKVSGVYKITNTITNDFYIGSSNDVKQRWADHKKPSTWRKCPSNPMYLDMQKYGTDKFSFEILEEADPESLKEAEQQFIEKMHPTYNNYNAKGLNVERQKEHKKEHYQQNRKKYKEYQIEYYQQNREKRQEYQNQPCSYNGEVLTLNALRARFKRAGIAHSTLEAKKYIIKSNNPIEFYDVYP